MSRYTINTDNGEVVVQSNDIDRAIRMNEMTQYIHENNKKWWIDLETREPKERNVGEMLMLAVSELSEALEGHRKNQMDDHLPHRKMFEVEIADCIIRLFDISAGLGYDLGGAFVEKSLYNQIRKDHSIEHRKSEHGKKY